MSLPIKLISTDFDGTIFAEFENPPIPHRLVEMIGRLQAGGAKWIINTGRDMSSLMEALGRAHVPVQPDYLVLVEREIYYHHQARYIGIDDWNQTCARVHEELFARVRADVPKLIEWINARFSATLYDDAYSPFCLIAGNNGDADVIHDFLTAYCERIPDLVVVRNDVYARFSHRNYTKGSALAEVARRRGITREYIFAAGDHLNDLPMLSVEHAGFLAAPDNAVPLVKEAIRRQNGILSGHRNGHGIADALDQILQKSVAAG